MAKILIVEDSNFFSTVLKWGVETALGFEAVCATSYAETKALLADPDDDIYLAFLDLNLSDAPNGEVVDLVVETGLPVVVFTGDVDQARRDEIFQKGVIDYVLKDTASSVDYLLSLARRIFRNRGIKAIVVDDSKSARKHIGRLLEHYQFDVMEAEHGPEALAQLSANPDTKLLVVDYEMPGMDSFELIRRVRADHSRETLVVIGISGTDSGLLSAKLIKYGANDFISKPFIEEEFLTRITQNLNMLDYLEQTRESADIDFLTGLYNRRFLYNSGAKLVANAKRTDVNVVVAVIDIDFFKSVNDQLGHDVGDQVLRSVGALLQDRFREGDVVARMGGEEFCVVAVNMEPEVAFRMFESLRESVAELGVASAGTEVKITASIGVSKKTRGDLDEMIKHADGLLYEAKQAGRNRVAAE